MKSTIVFSSTIIGKISPESKRNGIVRQNYFFSEKELTFVRKSYNMLAYFRNKGGELNNGYGIR